MLNDYDENVNRDSSYERDEDDAPLVNWIRNLNIKLKNFELSSVTGKIEKGLRSKNSKITKRLNDFNDSLTSYITDNFMNNKKHSEVWKRIRIFKFIEFIFLNISIIEIRLKKYDDINEIFKSINSKGRVLNQWDLIRNEISKGTVILKDIEEKKKIENDLNSVDTLLGIFNEKWLISPEEFIWSYIIFKSKQFVSKKDLATKFTILAKEKKISLSILLEDIEHFSKILEKHDDTRNTINRFKWFAYICKEIRAVQIKIVVFSTFMAQNFQTFNCWVDKFLADFVLFVNISGRRANFFERFFKLNQSLEILLSNNEKNILTLINKQDFHEENKLLKSEYVEEKLSDANRMIKIYIYFKTSYISGNNQEMIFPLLSYEYEHVLPKKYEKWVKKYDFWKNIDDIEIEKYVEKVGNVILLKKELNKKVGNNILEDKLKEYFKEINCKNKLNNKLEPKYTIFSKSLNLSENELNFLIPIFGIFQDWYNNKTSIEFRPTLIEERTTEISKEIAKLLLNEFK